MTNDDRRGSVPMTDDWSNQEIVRAINALNSTVQNFQVALTALDLRYLPREVYEADRRANTQALERLTDEVKAATAEREQAQTGTRNFVLYPLIVTILGGVLLYLILHGGK